LLDHINPTLSRLRKTIAGSVADKTIADPGRRPTSVTYNRELSDRHAGQPGLDDLIQELFENKSHSAHPQPQRASRAHCNLSYEDATSTQPNCQRTTRTPLPSSRRGATPHQMGLWFGRQIDAGGTRQLWRNPPSAIRPISSRPLVRVPCLAAFPRPDATSGDGPTESTQGQGGNREYSGRPETLSSQGRPTPQSSSGL